MDKPPKVYDSYWDRYRAKRQYKGAPMQHFRYIDTISRPDGTLRPYKEQTILAKYEQWCNELTRDAPRADEIFEARQIKDRESNGR